MYHVGICAVRTQNTDSVSQVSEVHCEMANHSFIFLVEEVSTQSVVFHSVSFI